MKHIYLDHCASAFPKAPGVGEAMERCIRQEAGAGRELAEGVGERLLSLTKAPAGTRIWFTSGGLREICLLLWGLLRPGDRVLTSPMEEGAVLAALERSKSRGVEVELLPCTSRGELILDDLETRLTPNTRAIYLTHASPVSGTVFPIDRVGRLCREWGIFFLTDVAQTLGVLPVDMAGWGIDGLIFPGYQGLLGPQGVGGLMMTEELAWALEAWSLDLLHPRAGEENLPGIAGLGAALDYLAQGGEAFWEKTRRLSRHLWYRLKELDGEGLRVLGSDDPFNRVGVVSVDLSPMDHETMAACLEQEYGIRAGWGLHGAPLACKTLGVFPQGTVRFSVSPFTTFGELDYLEGALEELLWAARNQ